MHDGEAARLEHERRRWLRPDWERYLRPDWESYVHPAHRDAMRKEIAERKAAFEPPRCARERLRDEQTAREQLREEIAVLERESAWEAECAERKLRSDLAWERFKAAMVRQLSRKAGYNPDQPRDEFGRWTDGGQGEGGGEREGGEGGDGASGSSAPAANNENSPHPKDHNQPPSEIPQDRPEESRDRTAAIRAASRYLGIIVPAAARLTALGTLISGAVWLRAYRDEILTNLDPPKTLEELHDAVAIPRSGTHRHHIVEQGPAEADGYPRSEIDAPENLVRIPKQKHQDISDWYSTKNDQYGGETPRDWLRGKSWEERRAVGIMKLIELRVLKP